IQVGAAISLTVCGFRPTQWLAAPVPGTGSRPNEALGRGRFQVVVLPCLPLRQFLWCTSDH
ncbi:MAG: hypothetical protein ACC700_20545, partial [Anaerolineales bacterium]